MNKKSNFLILLVLFSAVVLFSSKSYAYGSNFNSYYVGINGGFLQTGPSGSSSKTGGRMRNKSDAFILFNVS